MADQKDSLDKDKLQNLLFLRGVEFESIPGLLEDCPFQAGQTWRGAHTCRKAKEDGCSLLVLDEETLCSLVDVAPSAGALLFVLVRRLCYSESLILSSQDWEQEFERYAFIDGLIRLYERRWFESMLPWQSIRFKRNPEPLFWPLIGINDFSVGVARQAPSGVSPDYASILYCSAAAFI